MYTEAQMSEAKKSEAKLYTEAQKSEAQSLWGPKVLEAQKSLRPKMAEAETSGHQNFLHGSTIVMIRISSWVVPSRVFSAFSFHL